MATINTTQKMSTEELVAVFTNDHGDRIDEIAKLTNRVADVGRKNVDNYSADEIMLGRWVSISGLGYKGFARFMDPEAESKYAAYREALAQWNENDRKGSKPQVTYFAQSVFQRALKLYEDAKARQNWVDNDVTKDEHADGLVKEYCEATHKQDRSLSGFRKWVSGESASDPVSEDQTLRNAVRKCLKKGWSEADIISAVYRHVEEFEG